MGNLIGKSFVLNPSNSKKYFFVDKISEYEIDPLTDGSENLLLYEATCYQKGVIYLDIYSEGPWLLKEINQKFHVFKSDNFILNFYNSEIEEEIWYNEKMVADEQLNIGEKFSSCPLDSSYMYVFSSTPNRYKRFYEND